MRCLSWRLFNQKCQVSPLGIGQIDGIITNLLNLCHFAIFPYLVFLFDPIILSIYFVEKNFQNIL